MTAQLRRRSVPATRSHRLDLHQTAIRFSVLRSNSFTNKAKWRQRLVCASSRKTPVSSRSQQHSCQGLRFWLLLGPNSAFSRDASPQGSAIGAPPRTAPMALPADVFQCDSPSFDESNLFVHSYALTASALWCAASALMVNRLDAEFDLTTTKEYTIESLHRYSQHV